MRGGLSGAAAFCEAVALAAQGDDIGVVDERSMSASAHYPPATHAPIAARMTPRSVSVDGHDATGRVASFATA